MNERDFGKELNRAVKRAILVAPIVAPVAAIIAPQFAEAQVAKPTTTVNPNAASNFVTATEDCIVKMDVTAINYGKGTNDKKVYSQFDPGYDKEGEKVGAVSMSYAANKQAV